MKRKIEDKPCVGGRASICEWTLTFRFLRKDQISEFIKLLFEDSIDYNFECEYKWDNSENRYIYEVTIYNMSWAYNLETISKLLQKVDYKDE